MAKADKEYKRLSRKELLELLIEESEKSEELERQLQVACDELASKDLKIQESGSIAEAALALNGVFEAAQAACAQYLENIKRQNAIQDKQNAEREAKSREQAERIVREANQKARSIEEKARVRCEKLIALVEKKVQRQLGMITRTEAANRGDPLPQIGTVDDAQKQLRFPLQGEGAKDVDKTKTDASSDF